MITDDLISRSALANFAYHATDNMDVERCVVDWEDIEDAPAVDAVSRSVFEQVQWERDVAMQQLKDHGIPFGGTAPDAVDIEKALAWLEDYSILDRHEVYTNGVLLVPLFRVEQALVNKAYNGLREG